MKLQPLMLQQHRTVQFAPTWSSSKAWPARVCPRRQLNSPLQCLPEQELASEQECMALAWTTSDTLMMWLYTPIACLVVSMPLCMLPLIFTSQRSLWSKGNPILRGPRLQPRTSTQCKQHPPAVAHLADNIAAAAHLADKCWGCWSCYKRRFSVLCAFLCACDCSGTGSSADPAGASASASASASAAAAAAAVAVAAAGLHGNVTGNAPTQEEVGAVRIHEYRQECMILHTCLQLQQQQQQQLLQSCNEHWQTRAGILHFALVYGATASVAAQRGAVHHLTAHLVCSYASDSPVTNMFYAAIVLLGICSDPISF